MRKLISLILALSLILCIISFAVADDPDEIPGTTEMPYAGLRFVPPQAYWDAKGGIVTDGSLDITQDIHYAYWLYCAMPEDELNALYSNPENVENAPIIPLFYVFSIGGGMNFDYMNTLVGNPFSAEYAREIGKAGEYTFYLYMEDPNQEFANYIDPIYKDEYLAIAAMKDEAAAAFSCYEPLGKLAGLVGTKVEFTTTDLDGNPISSADLFAQHEVTMVNIWATWCGPCIGELAELQQIHTRLLEKDCAIVGLLNDTALDSARQLIADNGVTYPVILAPDNFYSIFPIEAYPSSFFIGRDGTILAAPIVGADVNAYESKIDALLQK